MSVQLDSLYLDWLYRQVSNVDLRTKAKLTHWSLLKQLYGKEFTWFVPNDDNRLQDGRDLRYEFIDSLNLVHVDSDWMYRGCSCLELLIALSRQLSFFSEGEPGVWFWHLIEMIDLEQYNDRLWEPRMEGVIDETMNRVINRTYAPDGSGGLFPLRNPTKDQREVELWYQLNAYLNEL